MILLVGFIPNITFQESLAWLHLAWRKKTYLFANHWTHEHGVGRIDKRLVCRAIDKLPDAILGLFRADVTAGHVGADVCHHWKVGKGLSPICKALEDISRRQLECPLSEAKDFLFQDRSTYD